MILCLTVLDGRICTHDDSIYHASISSRGKNLSCTDGLKKWLVTLQQQQQRQQQQQPLSSFRNTCPYHGSLFCCSISIISSIPSLSLNSLLGTLSFTLTLHIHLTILISARWSTTSFSFLTGQVSLPCSILLRTQLLYSLSLVINDWYFYLILSYPYW